MKPLVLFDLDGTLADSLRTIAEAANVVARKHGHKERNIDELLKELKTKKVHEVFGISKWKLLSFYKEGLDELKPRMKNVKPMKGASKIIKSAKKYAFIGVLSSNHKEGVQDFLKANKLDKDVDVVEQGTVFGKNKTIKKIAKSLGVPVQHVLYVGDETRDIHAARRAKCSSLAVTWGLQNQETLMKARPNMLATSIDEANELIYAWLTSLL